MDRPPRDPMRNILSAGMLRVIGLWGLALGAVTMAGYLWALQEGDLTRTRTICFMVLALAQLFHLGTARSRESLRGRHATNRWALGAVGLVLVLQLLAVYLSPLAALLDLTPPAPLDWIVILGLSVLPATAGQLIKLRRS